MEVVKETEEIKIVKLNIQIASTDHYTNTYILIDPKSNKAVVIDPAYNGKYIKETLDKLDVTLDSIIVTHGHADHIGGVKDLVNMYDSKLKIYIHILDKTGLVDEKINEQGTVGINIQGLEAINVVSIDDKNIIYIGDIMLEVIHTPGHTKGSICLYNEKSNILFSGDTIFHNTYGRTDLYWSDKAKMKDTLDNLFERFEDIDVFPGHDKIFNLNDAKKKIRLLYAFKG